jgi:hypothetical protein
MILETDTKKMFIWPGSGSFVEVVNSGAATATSTANAAQSAASTAQNRADAAYALASSGTSGSAVDTVARDAAAAANTAAGIVNSRVTSLRPLFYSTEAEINVSSSQTTWGPLPDSPAKGLAFTAPASGKITVIISGEVRGRAGSTGLGYIIRTGSGLGSGSVPTTVSGYTPFNPGFLGALGINSFGTSTSGTEDTIINGSGHVGYHSGLTPGSNYNITFAHYNSNSVGALIKWRSMVVTPLP